MFTFFQPRNLALIPLWTGAFFLLFLESGINSPLGGSCFPFFFLLDTLKSSWSRALPIRTLVHTLHWSCNGCKQLENKAGEPNSVSIVWKPETLIPADIELIEKIIKMIDSLEDNDDVQNVYTNLDAAEEALEQLGD